MWHLRERREKQMDRFLRKIIDTKLPQANKSILKGIARDELTKAMSFIDTILSNNMTTMTKSKLKYLGCERCSPRTEFKRMLSRTTERKTVWDISRTDFYCIDINFEYDNIPFRRHLLLPYSGKGGITYISDTPYAITPVLTDTVLSPSKNELFAKFYNDKMIFKRYGRNFVINGAKVAGQIIHTNIYRVRTNDGSNTLGKVYQPIALYVLGKYGLREALKRKGITDYKVTDNVVTPEDMKKYDVYESTGVKPRGLRVDAYVGHRIKILIPKNKATDYVNNLVYSILYILDIFPEDGDNLLPVHNTVDELDYWRLLMGRAVFTNSLTVTGMLTNINSHFEVLEGYMDSITKAKLETVNIKVDCFYELLIEVLSRFNDMLINYRNYNSDVNNSYIEILYYILFDIIVGINKTLYGIRKRESKKILTIKELERLFNTRRNLSPRTIYGIVKSNAMNLTVSRAEYSGDLLYPKITSMLEHQSRGNGVTRGTRAQQFPEVTKTLRGADLFIGSLLYLGKKAPSPLFRINMFMTYDPETGKPTPNKYMSRLISKLESLLKYGTADVDKITP